MDTLLFIYFLENKRKNEPRYIPHAVMMGQIVFSLKHKYIFITEK